MSAHISIENYRAEFAPAFAALNLAWIEKFFVVEEQDQAILFNPEQTLLAIGGSILFALESKLIVGCVALKPIASGVFELTKMAVSEDRRGQGIGAILMQAAIEEANQLGARKLVLYTHSSLQNAIALYRRHGFVQLLLEGANPYQRSDVYMQRHL